jgi:hypothetical protein
VPGDISMGYPCRRMNLTTYLHLVPILRIVELYFDSHIEEWTIMETLRN